MVTLLRMTFAFFSSISFALPDFVVETGARAHGNGFDLFGLFLFDEEAPVRAYHVALQVNRLTARLGRLQLLLHLLFGVYGCQPKYEQVHRRGQRDKASQYE